MVPSHKEWLFLFAGNLNNQHIRGTDDLIQDDLNLLVEEGPQPSVRANRSDYSTEKSFGVAMENLFRGGHIGLVFIPLPQRKSPRHENEDANAYNLRNPGHGMMIGFWQIRKHILPITPFGSVNGVSKRKGG